MDTIEEQPLGKQATLICDVFLHKVKVQNQKYIIYMLDKVQSLA